MYNVHIYEMNKTFIVTVSQNEEVICVVPFKNLIEALCVVKVLNNNEQSSKVYTEEAEEISVTYKLVG